VALSHGQTLARAPRLSVSQSVSQHAWLYYV